jgi:hypothetical protein
MYSVTVALDHTSWHKQTRKYSSGIVIGPSWKPVPDSTQQSQETDVQTPARFEPAIPASERQQTPDLDRAAVEIDLINCISVITSNIFRMFRKIMFSKYHKQWTHENIKCLYVLLPCSVGPSRDPQSPSPHKQKSAVSPQLASIRQSGICSFPTGEQCASLKHDYVKFACPECRCSMEHRVCTYWGTLYVHGD